MIVAAVLVAVTSSSLWLAQMPGGGAPRGMERERVRTAPPPPSSPELRRLEGIRARFDFAADSGNRASLEVLDGELLAALAQVEGPPKPPVPVVDAGAANPGEEGASQPLTRAVMDVRGRYDAPGLAARRKVLNALLARAIREAADNAPPRDETPVPQQEAPRGRGRRR
jgi:hypothetical protein